MADQKLPRQVNERRVLSLLRMHGALTRAEIARRLALTRATITYVVDDLIGRELVIEDKTLSKKKSVSEVGRPGINVHISPNGGYYLGVEIGVGIIRFALIDLTVTVVSQLAVECSPQITPEEVLDLICAHYDELNARERFKGRIRAIGLTVPGLVRNDGFIVHLPILGWKGINILGMAELRLPVPLTVENNANAAAFGEVYSRSSMVRDAVIYLKIGTGCGGASIINGRLLRGTMGTATEFGHLRISADGAECGCGRVGCLEPRVNLAALHAAFDPQTPYSTQRLRALPAQLAEMATGGDARAIRAIDVVAASLEQGLVTLINIFNPRSVLLGGSMRPVIEYLLPRLRTYVNSEVVPGMFIPDIRLSHLGDMECAIGAASLVHNNDMDISNLELTASV